MREQLGLADDARDEDWTMYPSARLRNAQERAASTTGSVERLADAELRFPRQPARSETRSFIVLTRVEWADHLALEVDDFEGIDRLMYSNWVPVRDGGLLSQIVEMPDGAIEGGLPRSEWGTLLEIYYSYVTKFIDHFRGPTVRTSGPRSPEPREPAWHAVVAADTACTTRVEACSLPVVPVIQPDRRPKPSVTETWFQHRGERRQPPRRVSCGKIWAERSIARIKRGGGDGPVKPRQPALRARCQTRPDVRPDGCLERRRTRFDKQRPCS